MSGVGRHRPENAGLGVGRSAPSRDYTARGFPPDRSGGLGLDGQGPQAPKNQKEKEVSRRLAFQLARGSSPAWAETRHPALSRDLQGLGERSE
jgi:hypothetical protein